MTQRCVPASRFEPGAREMRTLRDNGCQIDRMALAALDANGDYRVKSSPGRLADDGDWVSGTVPTLPPTASAVDEADQARSGVFFGT